MSLFFVPSPIACIYAIMAMPILLVVNMVVYAEKCKVHLSSQHQSFYCALGPPVEFW